MVCERVRVSDQRLRRSDDLRRRPADILERYELVDQPSSVGGRRAAAVEPAAPDRSFQNAFIRFGAVELAHEFQNVPSNRVVRHRANSSLDDLAGVQFSCSGNGQLYSPDWYAYDENATFRVHTPKANLARGGRLSPCAAEARRNRRSWILSRNVLSRRQIPEFPALIRARTNGPR